jgi:hypothetical protein
MRLQRLRDWLNNERGNVLLFTFTLLIFLLVMGGFAMDFAYQAAARTELQRSIDAAALAGAGKLGFNDSVFDIPCGPAAQTCSGVRQNAQRFASRNPYRVGNINLDLNLANAANGDIVLGIWNGTGFTPSLEGSQVNAVLCRTATQVPTSLLRLLGLDSLTVSAEAIAWAPPPASPPPTSCVFPVAVSACSFNSGGTGATSSGCGTTIQFTSSSDASQIGANTAAWVGLDPNGSVNAPDTSSAVDAAASGNCGPSLIQTGDTVPVNNGELASVIKNHVKPAFADKYNASPELVVYAQDGTTVTYQGKGWEVFVPVVDTGSTCPPGAITGGKTIVGWTRMVITQVLDNNGECTVANHWAGNPWDSKCFASKNGTAPAGSPTVVQGNTGIFGYYDCQYTPSPPATSPGPISARAKLKLVR